MYIYTQQGLRLRSVVEYLDVFVNNHQNISVLNVSNRELYIYTSIYMHIYIHTTGAEAPLGGGISRRVPTLCRRLSSSVYWYVGSQNISCISHQGVKKSDVYEPLQCVPPLRRRLSSSVHWYVGSQNISCSSH